MSATTLNAPSEFSSLRRALPFALSFTVVPVIVMAALQGGVWLLLPPLYTWALFSLLDALLGLNEENPDTDTPEADLYWYRAIVMAWFPVQALTALHGAQFPEGLFHAACRLGD